MDLALWEGFGMHSFIYSYVIHLLSSCIWRRDDYHFVGREAEGWWKFINLLMI